ncbi:DUF5680 domain-containing protein [Paenibacillus silvae]|uniref:DUF5680 domain-containing protein n=1 Tax=Paenibacillus silvae TaxID=1325358 RepID=UPI0020058A35|nr:DUF5680 domain-containing protein [Paenibacillus silvae]MCK6076570.1 hypothetical protein [Paenibacillus silvae]MCK6150997.1 hypothetical protein [Paenibacillus silvae]MCK6269257.1 hypothetical protein [Paenibacillus silvae]
MNGFKVDEFLDFLVEAKKLTYASVGDDFSEEPLLDGSIQLEYTRGSFYYRDIYFGTFFFSGLETVYSNGTPIWTMSYSGGVSKKYMDQTKVIYLFLQNALKSVTLDSPFRGPSTFSSQSFTYVNQCEGNYELFVGNEAVLENGENVYTLHYSGGLLVNTVSL